MTLERLAPDAILASANLNGAVVANIQDDPDSPDGNWMTATGNNVATECRVGFPSTAGPVLSATQEFRAVVKKQGGTGTPTGRLELWKAGVLVSAGSAVNVTSTTGQVISYSWAGTGHAPADIECKFVGTASGGSPSVRASVDLGALEWNADSTTPNTAPSVNVGADAIWDTGVAFSRTAVGTDPEGDTLTYAWTIQSAPAGSTATLTGAATVTVGITPDASGSYALRCTATDPGGLTGFDDFILTAEKPGTPTVSDTFNRVDSATTMGNADTGQTWVPLDFRAAWGISGNQAYQVSGGAQQVTAVETGAADGRVQVTVAVAGDAGLSVRIVDNDNYIVWNGYQLYRKVAGSFVAIGPIQSADAAGDVSAIVLAGSSITVQRNGVDLFTLIETAHQTATRHGLRSNNATTARFDNFTFIPLSELLTDEQQGTEGTGVLEWEAATNCTIARSTTEAHGGVSSLAITAIADGSITITLAPRAIAEPGYSYWSSLWLRHNVVHFADVYRRYYSATGGLFATADVKVDPVESTTAWYQAIVPRNLAPVGAATIGLTVQLFGLTAGEVVYLDDASLLGPVPTTAYGVRGALGWYDASQESGVTNGTSLATLADRSGANNPAEQATSANQATFQTAAINGKSVYRFNGGQFYYLSDLSSLTQGEIFIALKVDADPPTLEASSGLWALGTASGSTHFPYTDGVVHDEFGTNFRKTVGDPTPALTTPRIYNVASGPAEWTARLDGTVLFTTASNVVGFGTVPKIGQSAGSFFLDGDVGEIVMFSRILTAAERATVLVGMQTKWITPPPAGSSIKYWDGSSWVSKPLKRWDGSVWVAAVLKRWDGSAWQTE